MFHRVQGASVQLPGLFPSSLLKSRSQAGRHSLAVQAYKSETSKDTFQKKGVNAVFPQARSESDADRELPAIYHGATERARDALKSTPSVDVDLNGARIAFMPKENAKRQGLIIYPGAFVDHKSYAVPALAIAEKGYPVMIANTPFNVLGGNFDRPTRIMKEFPQVEQWAVAGHSFGGRMVDYYGNKHQQTEKLKGLVYWGTFPILNFSKADRLKTLMLIGTKEDMLKKYDFLNYEKNLTPQSRFVKIPGGIHSYFADYGLSFGDGKPEISRAHQQEQVVALTTQFLDSLQSSKPEK